MPPAEIAGPRVRRRAVPGMTREVSPTRGDAHDPARPLRTDGPGGPEDTEPPGGRLHGSKLIRLGLAAAVVSRVASRLVGIVLVTMLARHASAHTVAVYGYLLGTSSLVIGLTDLGVASIAGREVAARRMPAGVALLSAAMPQAASLSVAAILTVVLTLTIGPNEVSVPAMAITVAYILTGGFNNLIAELLRGKGRVVLEGLVQMGAATAVVVGGVLVIDQGGSATALLAVVLAKELAVLVLGIALIPPHRGPGLSTGHLLRQSIWLALAGTALIILWRQGMLLVGATGSIAALAAYVVASRYLDAGISLAHITSVGLRPGMCALADDPPGLRRAVRRYLWLATVIGTVVGVVGWVAAGPLVSIPFGPRWHDAVGPVQVIALSALPILLTYVSLAALVARHQTRLVGIGGTAGTAAGVLVSLLLMRGHPGAISPIIGTAFGATVVAAVFLTGLRDLLGPSGPHPSHGDAEPPDTVTGLHRGLTVDDPR